MSVCDVKDTCIVCSKIIKNCHKNITCKICKSYVHKKCTKLKPRELTIYPIKWTCFKCSNLNFDCNYPNNSTAMSESNDFNIKNVDLEKFDNMQFNPMRFESIVKNEANENN